MQPELIKDKVQTIINKTGKKSAREKLQKLYDSGGTSFWAESAKWGLQRVCIIPMFKTQKGGP